MKRILLLALGVFSCGGAEKSGALGAEQHYFRADHGVAEDAGALPDELDPKRNLAWRVAVDEGHSTPILVGNRLFLTTWNAGSKELATVAIEAETGKTIWRVPLSPETIEQTHQIGSPATASVACDGKRVLAFFGSAGMFCYDLAGKKVWEKKIGPFRDEYGAGSSPIVFDGKVILNEDHDIDSFLIALDTATGRTLWKVARPDAVRSYATPVVWPNAEGKPEVLVAGALQLTSYDPADGSRLWWVNGLARIVIPTPVFAGSMFYVPSWSPGGDAARRVTFDAWPDALAKWDSNHDGKLSKSEIDNREVLERFSRMDLNQDGVLDKQEWERHAAIFSRARNSLLAIRTGGRGELPDSAVVWKYDRGVPYVPSPVLDHSILWMVKDGGIVTKLDPKEGKVLQEERLPTGGSYYASPVAGDGKIYFTSESGMISVVRAEKEWKVISWRDLNEKIFATPVLSRGRVFIRSEAALYCFRGGTEGRQGWSPTKHAN